MFEGMLNMMLSKMDVDPKDFREKITQAYGMVKTFDGRLQRIEFALGIEKPEVAPPPQLTLQHAIGIQTMLDGSTAQQFGNEPHNAA
jgi:hypothetical protein